MIITIKHTKAVGYCNRGLRKWFDGRDIAFSDFLANGASDEWFLAQGDAMADRLVEHARASAAAEESSEGE